MEEGNDSEELLLFGYMKSGDKQKQKLTISLIDVYTLRAVGQEDFSDVQVPDTPAEPKKQ